MGNMLTSRIYSSTHAWSRDCSHKHLSSTRIGISKPVTLVAGSALHSNETMWKTEVQVPEMFGKKLNSTLDTLKSKYSKSVSSASIPAITGTVCGDDIDSLGNPTLARMDNQSSFPSPNRRQLHGMGGPGCFVLGGSTATRSISMNSVSSDGSSESHLVEQEDIIELTHDVRNFKEALGKLRRIFHPDREKQETMRVAAHERLGEVLRILRTILESYPPIQSTELLMAAGTMIQNVKGHNYEDEKADPKEFLEAIDQLALAFSSRVSEYLMGDLDSTSQVVPKTKSCENLTVGDGDSDPFGKDKPYVSVTLTPQEIDLRLLRLGEGVELALHRAKVWSKYAKDVIAYIDKRAHLETEHARNIIKLAQGMRPVLKDESFLPFQSIYCTALDQDLENSNTCLATCALLQGHKFVEPLTSRRNEHEKLRKQIKEMWQRELKKMHEAVSNLRKAKGLYTQRQQEYEKAKESAIKAESSEGSEGSKVDKKRRLEDDALQRAMEAETTYKACVVEANDRQQVLERIKADVLQQVRELIYQCDQTMKAVTVGYFQLQHTISAPAPVQFQTLCESSRLYEPGAQYMEFVKRLPLSVPMTEDGHLPFAFEPYSPDNRLDKDRRSNGSNESCEDVANLHPLDDRISFDQVDHGRNQPVKAWSSEVPVGAGSDSDSVSSFHSNKSQDTSPTASPQISQHRVLPLSSGDELDTDQDNSSSQRPCMSKAAETHAFRKLKTPARCRECDCYVYFQGVECTQCGLASHRKCLEALAIQCGRKRLPRKMTTFGVDLNTHARETGEAIPYIVVKCVTEIDTRGRFIKGMYRVSGVKSKVEKLCQCFENGADLVDLTEVHPNVVANVLKLYLRQLPEPLMTFRHYPDFIKVAKDYPTNREEGFDSVAIIEELREITKQLPQAHYDTLAYLMHHLKRVSEHSDVNNMPPSNLGIVFGPTLLRTSEGCASLSSLVDTIHQTRVIELLISYASEIFGTATDEFHGYGLHRIDRLQKPKTRGDGKIFLSRTVSGACQMSDLEDRCLPQSDYGCSLPGYLAMESREEHSARREDRTGSLDDWLGFSIPSDDELLDITLPDDSATKPSSLFSSTLDAPYPLNFGRTGKRMFLPHLKTEHQALKSSLSTPTIPTDASLADDLVAEPRGRGSESPETGKTSEISRAFGPESDRPVPPPRKNAQGNHSSSQVPLKSDWDRDGMEDRGREANPPECLASESVYTSSATVSVAGQKIYTSALRTKSSSSMTAELRRQFFEAPPIICPETVFLSQASLHRERPGSSSQSLSTFAPQPLQDMSEHNISAARVQEEAKETQRPKSCITEDIFVMSPGKNDPSEQTRLHSSTLAHPSQGTESSGGRYVSPLTTSSLRGWSSLHRPTSVGSSSSLSSVKHEDWTSHFVSSKSGHDDIDGCRTSFPASQSHCLPGPVLQHKEEKRNISTSNEETFHLTQYLCLDGSTRLSFLQERKFCPESDILSQSVAADGTLPSRNGCTADDDSSYLVADQVTTGSRLAKSFIQKPKEKMTDNDAETVPFLSPQDRSPRTCEKLSSDRQPRFV